MLLISRKQNKKVKFDDIAKRKTSKFRKDGLGEPHWLTIYITYFMIIGI